jgi:hypothetical protein
MQPVKSTRSLRDRKMAANCFVSVFNRASARSSNPSAHFFAICPAISAIQLSPDPNCRNLNVTSLQACLRQNQAPDRFMTITMPKIIKMRVLILALMAIGMIAEASAQDQRYTLERTANGYVRTNTATGETSVCTEKGNQLVCRMAADDRQAFETDVIALEAKIDSLEQRIIALEKSNPAAPNHNPPDQTEFEFQTSLDRMEQFFRRFMEIVKEFNQFGGDNPPPADRT